MIHLFTDPLLLLLLVVPAHLVHRLLRPRPTLLQAASETLLLSVTLVPILVFLVCLLGRQYITVGWMAGGSAVLTLFATAAHVKLNAGRLRETLLGLEPSPGAERCALVVAALVFALFLINYDRRHFEYGCINGVVMQALTAEAAGAYDPHEGAEEDGAESTDWGQAEARGQSATMDLLDVHGTGQRLGTTAVIAPIVALFDVWGFRLIYALLPALCLLFGFRLARTLDIAERPALAAAALAILNPYVLKIVILDENVMAFCFATVSLALLLEHRRSDARDPWALLALSGVAFGAALGIRHIDLAFGFAALVLMGRHPKHWLIWGGVALVFAAPCAFHHHFTYGSVLRHEHFVDEVFLSVPHRFLWWDFQYTGLLNWPFAEAVVRTPYNPYPTGLYYPLNTVAHLGTGLAAVALIGFVQLIRERRRLLLALMAWIVPQYALLAVLENWMDPNKMGIIITLFPALVVTLALGFGWLSSWKRAGIWVGVAAALSGVMLLVGGWSALDDPRFYEKFPRVRPEQPEYAEFERAMVATGDPLPSLYLLQQYTHFRPFERLSMLGQDFVDRRFRRPAQPIAAWSGQPVAVTIDLSRPLIRDLDFLSLDGDGEVVDATGPVQLELSGFRAWEKTPLDVLVARNGTHQVDLYLRFGEDGFADVASDNLFTIEPRARPQLAQQTTRHNRITLLARPGDRIRILETVCLDEVLVYVWEIEVRTDTAEVFLPRRMFHN